MMTAAMQAVPAMLAVELLAIADAVVKLMLLPGAVRRNWTMSRSAFPKSAAEYLPWFEALVAAVCTTSYDEDIAFP